jgi:hypothetical protein
MMWAPFIWLRKGITDRLVDMVMNLQVLLKAGNFLTEQL